MRRCCLVSILAACGPTVATTPDDTTSGASDQTDATATTSSESTTSSSTSTSPVDTSTGAVPCPMEIELTGDIVIDDTTDPTTLECVTRIDGTLTIGPSTTLTAPLPLAQLVEVTGAVRITENAALE